MREEDILRLNNEKAMTTNLRINPVERLVNRIRSVVPVLPDDAVGLLQEPVLSLFLPPVGEVSCATKYSA
jgi:hypothetical protein